MKKHLLLALIVLMAAACSNQNKTNDEATSFPLQTSDPSTTSDVEAAKNPITVDKGRLVQTLDGYSDGKDTELTELLSLLKKGENDFITIKWVWDCSPKYGDMPMRIEYDKNAKHLTLIYEERNVKEEYSNVAPECLIAYLESGKKLFYGLEDFCSSSYDFNNREIKR